MARNFKILLVVFVVVVIAAVVYALAAANTVPATKAGSGSGAITGYAITNVVYTLNGTNPTILDQVDFDLDATATSVLVRLDASTSTWYTCTNTVNHWTCNTTSPAILVADMDELTVVAKDH